MSGVVVLEDSPRVCEALNEEQRSVEGARGETQRARRAGAKHSLARVSRKYPLSNTKRHTQPQQLTNEQNIMMKLPNTVSHARKPPSGGGPGLSGSTTGSGFSAPFSTSPGSDANPLDVSASLLLTDGGDASVLLSSGMEVEADPASASYEGVAEGMGTADAPADMWMREGSECDD